MRNIRTTWLSVTNKVPSSIIRHVIVAWESRRALHSLLLWLFVRRGQIYNGHARRSTWIVVILLFDENICSTMLTSSNFHAYRNLSKQPLKKRIGLLQDRNDIQVTIQKTTPERKLYWILPRLPRVSKFTSGSFIHIAYDSSNQDHQYRSQKRVHLYFWD